MESRGLVLALAIFFGQFDLASGQASALTPQTANSHNVRTVARESLTDLAVAFADSANPVIYYNPRLMADYGADFSAFVMAHEYAHIGLGHRRPSGSAAGSRETLELLLQGWELEADCLAATQLARERPASLAAAIAFFERQGLNRVDREHPAGITRAARLATCGRSGNGDPRLVGEGPRTVATTIQFK